MQIFPLPSEGEGWGEGEKMKSGYKWMRLLRQLKLACNDKEKE